MSTGFFNLRAASLAGKNVFDRSSIREDSFLGATPQSFKIYADDYFHQFVASTEVCISFLPTHRFEFLYEHFAQRLGNQHGVYGKEITR